MKLFRFLLIASLVLGAAGSSFASSADQLTLLLVPREDGPVQVGMDVGNRFPTLLLSYRIQANGTVSLHGWDGSEWVNVTTESYNNGDFFKHAPASALIVERDDQEIPATLIPSKAWCPSVDKICTVKTRPLLHLIGRHYNFKYKDWKWFSRNYHLPLKSINPDDLNVAWYHYSLSENLEKKTIAGASDLQYFVVVRSPELAEPAAEQPKNGPEETGAADAEEAPKALGDNPLTNAVPPAEILGVGETNAMAAPVMDDAESTNAPTVKE